MRQRLLSTLFGERAASPGSFHRSVQAWKFATPRVLLDRFTKSGFDGVGPVQILQASAVVKET